MAFSIDGSTPPEAAKPTAPHSPGVVHPEATELDGNGVPCGAVGQPEAILGRGLMTTTGHAWWMAHFAAATDTSVTVNDVVLYDPLYEQERTFSSATMHRPTWNQGESNPGRFYRGYTIRFTNLVE